MHLVALADRFTPQSYGVGGCVWEDEGGYRVTGDARAAHIDARSFELLKRDFVVVDYHVHTQIASPVALWLGESFRAEAFALRAPALPSTDGWYEAKGGKFFVTTSTYAYDTIGAWVRDASRLALVTRERDLVGLIGMASPGDEYYALDYLLAPDAAARERVVDFRLRNLRVAVSREELVNHYFAVIEELRGG